METEGMTPEEQARLAEVQSRVERAVEKFDADLGPIWPSRIDLDALDMTSAYDCVVAQLFGEYNDGVEALWPDAAASKGWGAPGAAEYHCELCCGTREEWAARQAERAEKPLRDDLARSHGLLGDEDCGVYYDELQEVWASTIERLRQERQAESA